MTWLTENGLSLYGAITGTSALLVSFFGYRHNAKKDQIKLALSCAAHPEQAENFSRLNAMPSENSRDRPHFAEVYLVTVRNLGSIPAPLDDVGVMGSDGKKHQVLVSRRTSQMSFLVPLSNSDTGPLAPRASKTFSVYLKRDEPMFSAISAYAIDQTGKAWRVRA
jgi:hypothetical protein